jgi:hypothetical protein
VRCTFRHFFLARAAIGDSRDSCDGCIGCIRHDFGTPAYALLDTGSRFLWSWRPVSVVSFWFLVVGFWLLGSGCWDFGYSVFGCSVFGWRFWFWFGFSLAFATYFSCGGVSLEVECWLGRAENKRKSVIFDTEVRWFERRISLLPPNK